MVDSNLMYYEDTPTSFKSMHVPSLTRPRSTMNWNQADRGEAMMVEIYDEYLITKSRNTVTNKFKPMGFQEIKFNN